MTQMDEREMRMEQLLDAALAQYGEAEPLAGLEERVLGRLRSEKTSARPWRLWTAVAAAAVLLLVAVLVTSRGERVAAPPVGVAKAPVVANPPQPRPATPVAVAPPVRPKAQATHVAAVQALPKRDVFPSPTPPSEQELLLAQYMRRTPRQEVMAMASRPPLTELPKDPLEAPAGDSGGSPPLQKFGR